jgi:L-serine dehydratase
MVSLLDIIGPIMVGPSSSHTAGACRIGLFARRLVAGQPDHALIELHGSFARTGAGHGTDRALAGGLLGLVPEDERLRDSLILARQQGLELEFDTVKLRGDVHPNTARVTVRRDALKRQITASSLGAGRIQVTAIDGYPVEVAGDLPTLVFVAADEPGVVAAASGILARDGENIATMRASRRRRGGDAIHIYELDNVPTAEAVSNIEAIPGVQWAQIVDRVT